MDEGGSDDDHGSDDDGAIGDDDDDGDDDYIDDGDDDAYDVGTQAMRTPSRTQEGLELLMEYYNQLFYLDQRFFPPNRNLGVHFHWYTHSDKKNTYTQYT